MIESKCDNRYFEVFMRHFFSVVLLCSTLSVCAQVDAIDPPPIRNLPAFWKGTLADIDAEVKATQYAQVTVIANSPGNLPIYLATYGEKEEFKSQANYNSAIGGTNPAFYAQKDPSTRPVLFFLGPVHGQEVEGMVGLVNLIHVLETGQDHRGKNWGALREKLSQCRVLIIPCGNPDGRQRCPHDSWVGLPTITMTKYGQGTRKDGSLYRWTGAKAVHPMRGDVGLLGAYFNDGGINPMHDDFFAPMAEETRAILNVARSEAPDMTVSLHSHENRSVVLQASFVPWFIKKRIADFSEILKRRFEESNLPYGAVVEPTIEDQEFPPKKYFNLVSALHHISGTMAFTFECSHGSVSERNTNPGLTHENILDIQLTLYQEMASYILENRLFWTLNNE